METILCTVNNKTILNIASGKLYPIEFKESITTPFNKDHFLVQLDPMYYSSTSAEEIEGGYQEWCREPNVTINQCTEDAFQFMEKSSIMFDYITIYRFLEHIKFTDISYFIYLISTSIEKMGLVDIIVPDYKLLAQLLINDTPDDINFDSKNILLTTELLNQPPDSHASIWTCDRIKYFWELEGRFKVEDIETNYNFDGRDIYLRAIIRRK